MLDRLSIDALLKSIIATLLAAIMVILGLGAWKSWTALNAADRIVAVTNASQQVFTALHNLRLDRAASLRDIAADRQFTALNPKIQNSRAVGMPALTAVLTALDAIDFPERPAFVAALDSATSSLAALHIESAAALRQPKASRRADLLVEFAREAAALIDALDRLSLRLTNLVKREDAAIDQLMQIKQFAWAAYNAAGDAAAMVSNPLIGRPVPPDAWLKYNGFVAQIDSTWAVLLDIASGPTLPTRLNEAIDRAMREFFAPDFSELRTKTLNALIAGEPPGITAEQWTPLAVAKLSSLLGIAEVALDTAKERAAGQRAKAMLALRIQLGLLAIAAVLAIAMMLVVARRITGLFTGKDEIGALADVAATGDMTEAVNEIACRALGVTIEAARAGAAGRGFAVAASAIGQLATQSAKAADEIGARIAGMRAATQAPVTAIQEISGTIGRMSDATTLAAAAVGEQGAKQQAAPIVTQAAQGTTPAGPVRAA